MIEEFKQELDKNKIRRIITLYNPEGCKKIRGKWDNKHHVCILSEIEPDRSQIFGWTAPIRGAYFWWHMGPVGSRYDEYGGEIGAVSVNSCDFYPESVCTDPNGIYYENFGYNQKETLNDFYKKIRDKALLIASDVKMGKAGKYDLIYFDETGEVMEKPSSIYDKFEQRPCPACMPVSPSFHRVPGFSFRKKRIQ